MPTSGRQPGSFRLTAVRDAPGRCSRPCADPEHRGYGAHGVARHRPDSLRNDGPFFATSWAARRISTSMVLRPSARSSSRILAHASRKWLAGTPSSLAWTAAVAPASANRFQLRITLAGWLAYLSRGMHDACSPLASSARAPTLWMVDPRSVSEDASPSPGFTATRHQKNVHPSAHNSSTPANNNTLWR